MKTYKKIFNSYLNNSLKLEKWQKIGVFGLVIVLAGVFGWLYEFVLYYFDGGMTDWFLQGGNFLPWINIYATGSIFVAITVRKIKKNPLLVFLVSLIVTGITEYISGWLVYTLGNGTRYWDYNQEIWNFGNIDGFICLRSVMFFAISSMMLIYLMIPACVYLSQKINKKVFLTVSIFLFTIFMADEFYNLIIANIFDLPNAMEVYKSLGFKYVEF